MMIEVIMGDYDAVAARPADVHVRRANTLKLVGFLLVAAIASSLR